ncbi:MAG: adenylosuccinate lyase [bacterium]|nr:adenylosuccinate lyase [bacterium]
MHVDLLVGFLILDINKYISEGVEIMDTKYIVPEIAKVWSEQGRFEMMLLVEVANCEAWHARGVIPEEDIRIIREAADINWRVYRNRLRKSRHDVSSFVAAVAYEVDKRARQRGLKRHPGRWIHYKLTSYDPWDTVLAMQIRTSIGILLDQIDRLLFTLQRRGTEHWNTVMIGRTHGMHAEPTTLGAKLANYWFVLSEHRKNLVTHSEFWQLAKISGPVGTHENVPEEVEEFIARLLGVRPIPIATQTIHREWVLRYLHQLSEVAATIEKIGTDIRLLQMPEISEVEEYFPEEAEGSSIMVHKRNPEVCERCCSLAREVSETVSTARANVPNWHERDLTTSANERSTLFRASNLAVYITAQMAVVIERLRVFPNRMRANLDLTAGIVQSGKVLNLLVEKGTNRTKARRVIAAHTNAAWQTYQGGDPMPSLREIILADLTIRRCLSREGIGACFDPTYEQLLEGVKVSFRRLGWNVPK